MFDNYRVRILFVWRAENRWAALRPVFRLNGGWARPGFDCRDTRTCGMKGFLLVFLFLLFSCVLNLVADSLTASGSDTPALNRQVGSHA